MVQFPPPQHYSNLHLFLPPAVKLRHHRNYMTLIIVVSYVQGGPKKWYP